jgi:ribonuclease Z
LISGRLKIAELTLLIVTKIITWSLTPRTCEVRAPVPLAFHVDIRVRQKNYGPDGVKLDAHEIGQGLVFDHDGIKISAFEVDHGGEELPAYGYRIDYQGRSAALSGDTTFNENLIDHAQGADLLVHEVTALGGGAAEDPKQLKRIGANHTTPEQAGEVFARVRPKLAVYNHLLLFGSAKPEDLLPATRKTYDGPLLVGEDLLQIDIGAETRANRFEPKSKF